MAPKRSTTLRLGQRAGLAQKTSITSLSISANGRFAATGDAEGYVRVFDLSNDTDVGSARINRKVSKYDRELQVVSVSDDGQHVAACDREKSIYVGRTGAKADLMPATTRSEGVVAFLPASRRAAVLDFSLRFYEGDAQKGEDSKHTSLSQHLAIAPDGRIAVVFQGKPNQAQLFDAKGKSLARVTLDADCRQARIGFVTNERVVIATSDGDLFFWNGKNGARLERRKSGLSWSLSTLPTLLAPAGVLLSNDHDEPRVIPLDGTAPRPVERRDAWACSPDGSVILSANGSRLERMGADLLMPLSSAALNGWVRGIAFEPDARAVWTVDETTAHRWSLPDATLEKSVALPKGHLPHGLSADARVLLLKELKKETQRLFDLHTSQWLCAPIDTHSRTSGLSADGRWFAYGVSRKKKGSVDGIEVLDVATGKVTTRLVASEPWVPYNAVPSGDGRFVVSVNNRYRIVTFDARSGRELGSFDGPRGVVMSLCVSASGKRFWFGRDNANVVTSHAPGGKVFPSLTGLRRNDVHTLALSPDEKWLAGSDGNSTAVWNLASGKRVLTLQEGAWSLAFSADSKQLAVGGNGTACVIAV